MKDCRQLRCLAMVSPARFARRHETPDRSPSGAENPRRSGPGDIDAVVFSGGGARCFWQAGFWQTVQALLPRPAVVAAVSGGAALAAVLFAGGWSRFFPRFLELAASSTGNVQLGNLLRRRPMFPHLRIARDSFLHSVSVHGLERLCAGPDFRIVISPPAQSPPRRSRAVRMSVEARAGSNVGLFVPRQGARNLRARVQRRRAVRPAAGRGSRASERDSRRDPVSKATQVTPQPRSAGRPAPRAARRRGTGRLPARTR